MSRTPADIDEQLAALYTERARLLREAAAVTERIEALEQARLQTGNDSGITSTVTKAQKQWRARAIAAGKAADRTGPGGAIAQAIARDPRWGSITAYARRRLKIGQPALSRYLSGSLDAPPEVRAAVAADFGLIEWPPRKR